MKSLVEKLLAPQRPNTATRREKEVAALIASGFTNQDVADGLKISIKTVEKHRESLHRKFGFRNTADLTRWALAHRLAPNEWL